MLRRKRHAGVKNITPEALRELPKFKHTGKISLIFYQKLFIRLLNMKKNSFLLSEYFWLQFY